MGSRLNRQSRTDRILIAAALAILLLATGLFYFDDWMWGGRQSRGEAIGVIARRSGDVRLKFQDDLKWQRAADGQDLAYNDAVYAGSGSQAELLVGESRMTVTENTLIVLRRDQDINFLNLSYGTLFGKVAKNEKLKIVTGNGKPIEFVSSKGARIVLRRSQGKTQLDVTSGEAVVTVDGKTSKVDKSYRLVMGDKSPADLRPNHLRLIKPLHDQVLVSEDPTRIEFAWEWENGRPADPSEHFTLEFSGQPGFNHIHATKEVRGMLTTSMAVSRSLSLYYRVKGPRGEVSPVEKVNFIRLQSPVIVKPLADSRFEAPRGRNAMVEFEFKRPADATVWYQLAADKDFKRVIANQNTPELKQIKELGFGEYYLRARADFGSGRVSSWTAPRVFTVAPEPEILRLSQRHLRQRVLIPNRNYPASLYASPDARVQGYLADRGFLHDFFPVKPNEFDQLTVKLDGDESFTQNNGSWPRTKLRPGRYHYSYQAAKEGFRPSAWSETKKLDIAMEPPKPLGEASYGAPLEDGRRPAQWKFTPLLFARSYDVEVSTTPGFTDPVELKTSEAGVRAKLPEGEYFWRARARDAEGRLISSYSPAYKLKSMPASVPQFLAKNDREPQSTERTTTRIERVRQQDWERSGWWAWLGSGENYIDYRQSNNGRGSLVSHNHKGPSQYFEGGYLGGHGIGGLLSYKSTPGQMTFENATVTPNSYRWTTMSLEAVAQKTSPFSLFDAPVIYGMRAGIQQHRIPFLFLNSDASLDLKMNDMTTASFGLLTQWSRRRWTYYWTMRYQFPLSTKADGSSEFDINPVFAFDGSLGTSYNITDQFKVGLFWYGQWHQFNFVYGDGSVTNQGFQSLFYSNLDLRLGFDF